MGRSLQQRSRRSAWPRTALRVVAVVAVAVGVWFLAHHLVRPLWHHFFDLFVYRGAVQWWVSGEPLYTFERGHSGYGFTYPPFAALALSPLALGGWRVQAALITTASVGVVLAITWRVFAPVARRAGWPPLFAVELAVPVILLLDPVRETIAYGQINLLLMALVLADVAALRRGWRWAGMATGLAAAIKLTPAIFLVHFALTRRWRPVAVAVATFATASLAALLVSPRTSVEFWTSTLWDTSRVGHVDKTSNQSLLGVLARVAGPTPPRVVWLLLVVAVLAVGLWRAARAHAAGDELVGLVLTGLTGALVSPISWTHHLVWLLPGVLVLVDVAVGRPVAPAWPFSRPPRRSMRLPAGIAAGAVTVALCSSVIWYFQRDEGLTHVGGVLGALGENVFVWILLAVVVLLPARARVPVPERPAGESTAVLAAD